jgi:hypothetical protein
LALTEMTNRPPVRECWLAKRALRLIDEPTAIGDQK